MENTFKIGTPANKLPADLLDLYKDISPSTIGHMTDFGFLNGLQPLFRPIRILGPALTVRLPHIDGTGITRALEIAGPGDVLVIDCSGDTSRACWGEFRTYAAIEKGIAGVIIAGAVTDVRPIIDLGFPVFSLGISALTTRALNLEGEVNYPVSVAGVVVKPGDLIVADDDGVFAVDPAHARELGERALKKQNDEAVKRREKGWDVLLASRRSANKN